VQFCRSVAEFATVTELALRLMLVVLELAEQFGSGSAKA
jgi:hypothetical protein